MTPMRVAVALLLLAGVLLAFVGCASRGPAPPPAPTTTVERTAEEVAPAIAAPTATIVLLEAGSAPRTALAHQLPVGRAETIVVELGGTLTLAVGDMSPPEVRTPPLRVTVTVEAKPAVGGRTPLAGGIERVEVVAAPDVPASVVTAVRSDLEGLSGTRFTAHADAAGLVTDVSFTAPAGPNPQLAHGRERMRDALELLLPPLPVEPVGKGARWQVRRARRFGTAKTEEQAHYTLTEVSAARARLTVKLSATGEPQTLALSAMPAGATVSLSSLTATGGGKIEARPGELVHPTELRWTTTGAGSAASAEGPAEVTVHATSTVSIKRAK